MKHLAAFVVALALTTGTALAGAIESSVDAASLPKKKVTPLGLYLTPADAHAALEADPSIVFIDVRDPIEISYVGHASATDAIVPLKIQTHKFNAKKGGYTYRANENFMAEVDAAVARAGADKSTPIFLICRSGARSATAAKKLIEAGYTSVWNLIEGFEGDKSKAGERTVNGWRNAGLPWSYKIKAEAGWAPSK